MKAWILRTRSATLRNVPVAVLHEPVVHTFHIGRDENLRRRRWILVVVNSYFTASTYSMSATRPDFDYARRRVQIPNLRLSVLEPECAWSSR